MLQLGSGNQTTPVIPMEVAIIQIIPNKYMFKVRKITTSDYVIWLPRYQYFTRKRTGNEVYRKYRDTRSTTKMPKSAIMKTKRTKPIQSAQNVYKVLDESK